MHARSEYEAVTTYHDGKRLYLAIDRAAILDDVEKLSIVRRKPEWMRGLPSGRMWEP